MDAIYLIAHSSSASPSASSQALIFLYNLTVGTLQGGGGDGGSRRGNDDQGRRSRDRFYCTLYSVLLYPAMLSGKRHLTVYFNLISKALTNDADNKDYGEVRDKRGD